MLTHIRVRDIRLIRLTGVLVMMSLLAATSPASAFQGTPEAISGSGVSVDEALAQVTAEDGVIQFDVAENGTFFVWSGNPDLVDGFPTVGTPYVTQGYIYPAGTLDESNGMLADGSPEFPDKVIGHWSCYGWWLGDDTHAATSPPWLNTHLFNFGPEWGGAMLTSEGYSIDDLNIPLERALTGGSGHFANASGVQVETNLGLNVSGGMNFRYEIRLGES